MTDIAEFEAIGEEDLRLRIARGTFFGNRPLAEEWLRQQAEQRADLRYEESKQLAQRQLRVATITAITTAAIAALSAIIAALLAGH